MTIYFPPKILYIVYNEYKDSIYSMGGEYEQQISIMR